MKFVSTGFEPVISGKNAVISLTFDLLNDIDAVVATTSVSINMANGTTAASAKTQIAAACKSTLQEFHNDWKLKQTALNMYDKTALDTFLLNQITY